MGIVTEEEWGEWEGKKVLLYTLTNSNGLSAQVTTFGATWVSMKLPGQCGDEVDVVLGFDNMEQYTTENPFFGSTVGRVAGRIADGTFTIPGDPPTKHQAAPSDSPSLNPTANLHGGPKGFEKQVWTTQGHSADSEGAAVAMRYVSPDGDQGFPGEVDTTVTFRINDDNEFVIEFVATTTKPTPVSLCNHAYFNLAGHNAGKAAMDEHMLLVEAPKWLPTHCYKAPSETTDRLNGVFTGDVLDVQDSPNDLRDFTPVGEHADKVKATYPGWPHGDALVLANQDLTDTSYAATLSHPATGRTMRIYTTEPVAQMYYSTLLNVAKGKGGARYEPRSAICIEPQRYADAVHAGPPIGAQLSPAKEEYVRQYIDTILLRPGHTYRNITKYSFSEGEPMSP